MTWISDWNGFIPVTAEHEAATRAARRRLDDSPLVGAFPLSQSEYDDGNGLWITFEETPIYQAFSRKYHPQD